MNSQGGACSTDYIYQGVINDVIDGVREAFLDEGIDEETLNDIRREWEAKIREMNDPEPKKHFLHNPLMPPPRREHTPMTQITLGSPQVRMQYPVATVVQPSEHRQFVSTSHPGQNISRQQTYVMPMGTQQQYQGVRLQPVQILPQGQRVVYVQSGNVIVDPNSVHGQQAVLPNGTMYQLDGNTDRLLDEDDIEKNCSSTASISPSKRGDLTLEKMMSTVQLDGGGVRMSDSSSDEEDEMDPLQRLISRVESREVDEEVEEAVEDEPLNSDDDEYEDMEKVFEADNVIICQFEKVHRARNKWKLILKDGIMHIENRDHCFQKALGDADF